MKIVFIPDSMVPFNMASLEERPLGGMETAAIRFSEALESLGHRVTFICNQDNPPLSHPLFLPIRSVSQLGEIDVVIAIREWKPAFFPIKSKKFMFWTGDSYKLSQSVGIGDKRVSSRFDNVLCVSNWQAETLCRESGFPIEKAYVLRNGVHMPYFTGSETRKRKRLIYSSTPFRGLKYLPKIFTTLKEKHPELELHIFSDYAVYSKTNKVEFEETAMKELTELRKQFAGITGCFMHGNVKQEQLAREMMRSSILAYPSDFEETSCITAMEAQASGCVVLSSHLAALPETVGDAGILLKEAPGTDAYLNAFTETLDKLLSDDELCSNLSKKSLERASGFDWNKIAKGFTEFLEQNLGL